MDKTLVSSGQHVPARLFCRDKKEVRKPIHDRTSFCDCPLVPGLG